MSFIISYLYWHYSKAFLNIYGIFSNFFWATYRFFSIPLLLKTLFSPWRRLDDSYTKRLDIEEFFGTVIVNTLMRFVGMFMRLIVICIGFVCLFLIFVSEIALFIIWPFLPIFIIWLFGVGILKIV